MLEKQLMCAGLCLALFAHPVLAKQFSPALPQCKPGRDVRTPMPIWDADVTHDGGLSSAPPAGNGIVYINLFAENDDVHCVGASDDDVYTFSSPSPTTSGDLAVTIRGPATYVGSSQMCAFTGFYVSEVADRDGKQRTRFRPADKFEIMSSGLYCLGKSTEAAPAPGRAAHAAPSVDATLPVCKRSGDDRVPIAIWKPAIISHGYEAAVSSDPPQGDGRIVYVALALPAKTPCPKDPDALITVSRPDRRGQRATGDLMVNFRGNARQKGGRCVLEGFYMNEPVPGTLQGWVETYFGAVDEKKVIASGTYCLAKDGRRNGAAP